MFCGFADKEVLKQVKRGGNEAEAIQDETLEDLATGNVFLGMVAQAAIYFFHQANLVNDASHNAEVVDVLDKDFGGKVVHFSKILQATDLPAECRLKYSRQPINLRNVGFKRFTFKVSRQILAQRRLDGFRGLRF
jgi:hypothetical protein